MNVVCVHARNDARGCPGLREETKRELDTRSPWPVVYVDVTGDDTGYWRTLDAWWSPEDDLLVVEHDVVVRRTAFEDLDACPEPWCGYVYELAGGRQAALGFTRFRKELIADEIDAIHEAGLIDDDGMPEGHWVRLDTRIDRTLRERGYTLHEHTPALIHLNERQREVRYA